MKLLVALLLAGTLYGQYPKPGSGGGGGGGGGGVTSVATGNCLTGGPITTTGTISAAGSVLPKTSTYQVLAADFAACTTITVASGTFNITLVASGSQPSAGQYINILNYGSGVVTVVRSGQNINGGTASLVLNAAGATTPTSAYIISDGTNYFADVGGGLSSIPVQQNGSAVGNATTLNFDSSTVTLSGGTVTIAPTGLVTPAQIQAGQLLSLTTTSSSTTTFTATMAANDPLAAYVDGQQFTWINSATACAGGAMTMNVDGLGAVPLYAGPTGTTNLTSAQCGANAHLALLYDGTASAFRATAAAGTGVTSITASCGISGGTITGTGTIGQGWTVRAVTGTSDTILSTDCGKLVTYANAGAVAVTLPQGTGSFAAPFIFQVQNYGAGTVTITPTTSTINNGAATLVLTANQGAVILTDGSGNYQVESGKGGGDNGAMISNTSTQSMPGSANTILTFPNVVKDSNGFHGGTCNSIANSCLTVPSGQAGWYIVSTGFNFTSTGWTTNVNVLAISVGGTQSLSYPITSNVSGGGSGVYLPQFNGSMVIYLNATDYVQVGGYEGTTATVGVGATLSMARIN